MSTDDRISPGDRPDGEPSGRGAAEADADASTVQQGGGVGSYPRIGAYQLLQRLGEGGMGEVWLAEQDAPLRRHVALKIIKPGMDTAEVLARFDIERQALSMMDHPHIAKVFDAGDTPAGRPYFVMEYVPGIPITDYCDRHRLDTEQRLRLFEKVCAGVQHAHQKAVLHRDIKPANVLVCEVDGEPVPKIIDFGVAKATAQRLTERTVFTRFGAMIGTPAYMSPEQTRLGGEDVDTRSDVYSLGVLLYELIAGIPPFDSRQLLEAGFEGVLRIIREQDPPRPSTRLSTLGDQLTQIAEYRRTEPRKLNGQLRGDVDWIVMRALEKDRNRRYGSPDQLAADIQRHLRNEPVVAGPPTLRYRTAKFVRRHRAGVTITSAALLCLIAFTALLFVQNQRIERERRRALQQARVAEASELTARGHGLLESDPTSAIAHAVASLERADLPSTRSLIRRAMLAAPFCTVIPDPSRGNPGNLDVSPDGRRFAVGWTRDGKVSIHSIEGGAPRVLQVENPFVVSVAFNGDGEYVGVSTYDSTVTFFHSKLEHAVARVKLPGWSNLYGLADPARMLAVCGVPGERFRWFELSVPSGELRELGRSTGVLTDAAEGLAVDRRGRWIADRDGDRVVLLDPRALDRGPIRVLPLSGDDVVGIDLDPNSDRLAAIGVGGQVTVWDLTSEPARLLRRYRHSAQNTATRGVRFDRWNDRLVSFNGRTGRVLDLGAPAVTEPVEIRDQTHWIMKAAFLSDGRLVTCRNHDGSLPGIALWDHLDSASREIPFQAQCFCLHGTSVLGSSYQDGFTGEVVVPLEGRYPENVRLVGSGMYGVLASHIVHDLYMYRTPYAPLTFVDLVSGASRRPPAGWNEEPRSTLLFDRTRHAYHVVDALADTLLIESEEASTVRLPRDRSAQRTYGHWDLALAGPDTLFELTESGVLRWSLRDGRVEQVWSGDFVRAVLESHGRGLYFQDQSFDVHWVDLHRGAQLTLGPAPPRVWWANVSPSGNYGALRGAGRSVHVVSARTGERWQVESIDGSPMFEIDFDPRDRWMLISARRLNSRLVPLPPSWPPDATAVPDLLGNLKDRTNLRVQVTDDAAERLRVVPEDEGT